MRAPSTLAAIIDEATRDYYGRDAPGFSLAANVAAWLSDPSSWPDDRMQPVTARALCAVLPTVAGASDLDPDWVIAEMCRYGVKS